MICVYPADCTDFSNNGLGAVCPTSCTVTETLNGEWELTLVHPIDERDKWRKLTDGGILRVPVPAAMTPQINLVTQQYQTTTYDVEVYKVSTSRDPLRLRSGTGTKYKILGKYKKGTEVIVIEKTSSSWYEVTCPDGKHGYMSSEYLTYVRTEQQSTTTNVGFRNDVVEARQLRDQPFRIYRVVPELDKVTVYARHMPSRASCPRARTQTAMCCISRNCTSTVRISMLSHTQSGFTFRCLKPRKWLKAITTRA